MIARLIADKLGNAFGQQVIVENRPGGSGNVAVIATARAAPDGYTLVLPAMAYAVNPSLFSNVGYTFDQFVPVSIVTSGPLVLVVHPSLGVKSVQELIDLAKAQPGKINYGSGGNGSSLHLAAELFKQKAKVDLQHVPYKGTNDLVADLLTGRMPVVFLSPLIAKQHVAHGDVLALGITSAQRAASWADTPTIAEAGVPGYAMDAWYAILAPRGTPQDVVDKLSAAIAVAVKSPDVSEKLEISWQRCRLAAAQPRPQPISRPKPSSGTIFSALPASMSTDDVHDLRSGAARRHALRRQRPSRPARRSRHC